ICKMETLNEAYLLAKKNNGAPGIDGVTFEAIEESGVEVFLKQIQDELTAHRYRPLRNRRQEIPKGDGKFRVLGIPAICDRVVQGGSQAHPGTDLRGGLSTGLVWLPADADSP